METVQNLGYLVAAVLFIFGIKGLTSPRTAVRGNMLGASGMLLAAILTVGFEGGEFSASGWVIVLAGVVVGGAIGAYMATKVQMTGMPELVAVFNGFGGGASVLVGGAVLIDYIYKDLGGPASALVVGDSTQLLIATAASTLIGGVTFWGSMVAYLKLAGKLIPSGATLFAGQQVVNLLLLALALLFGIWLVADPSMPLFWALAVIASILGVLSVIRIGGGDMPVVISLLNSYSGLAAAATGFVLSNTVLIISGSLVGASGLILTNIMCKAMNRSLANVLFGVLAPAEGSITGDEIYAGRVKATSGEEVAMLLDVARRVVFVPGYGMAVAQAQHAVRDLANMLEARGAEVEYGIHPVAGRMPGHMNVLLAEADVDYDQLKEMDEVNPAMSRTDVCIVLGANDVVNPVARTDPNSPIAGMPIIDVDKAKTCVVIKRSLSPGFAGIPNPLFAADNALMFFSDGKKAILDIIAALKEL